VKLEAVERALREGAPLDDDGEVGRWLRRALLRDRAVLRQHPELMFPSLFRTGWWLEVDRRHPLRPLLKEWYAEWKSRSRRPWLRALRPPRVPLRVAALERYPGVPAQARPLFLDGGRVVAALGSDGGAAWDRTTGERVERALEAPPAPRFALVYDKGSRVMHDRGAPIALDVDGDWSLDCVADAPGGQLVAGGWFQDYDGIVCRIDPARRAVIWKQELRGPVHQLAVTPDGERLVVHARFAYVLAMDDGRVLNSTPVFPEGKLAFSADGRQLAVIAGGELQVWEMEELATLDHHPSTQDGFLQVAFSPNGRLLFTGNCLWDALTGKELGTIGVERTEGWLEGGPPRRGRRVLDDGFIEAGLGGIRRWGADCKQRFQRGGHFSLSSGDLLFSSDGGFYVAFHHGLEVRAVHDDRLIASHDVKIDRHFLELSPDDRHVAWVYRGVLHLWHLGGKERELGPADGMPVFSFDGKLLACDGNVWDVATGAKKDPASFRTQAHPCVGRIGDGLFTITHRESGEPLASIPADAPLRSDVTGTRWASAFELYALEIPT
jgi:hypothetical protein